MASIESLAKAYEELAEAEERYRTEALRVAREQARKDREAMYAQVHDLVVTQGIKKHVIVRETGISRASIYRWLGEHERLTRYVSGAYAPEPVPIEQGEPTQSNWTNVRAMPSGEVAMTHVGGDSWLMTPDGEAWNRTRNDVIDTFAEWPTGAKEAFDEAMGEAGGRNE